MDAQYERNIHSAFFFRLKTKGLLSPAFLFCCTPHFEKAFSLSQHGFQIEPILEGCFLLCFLERKFQLGSMGGGHRPSGGHDAQEGPVVHVALSARGQKVQGRRSRASLAAVALESGSEAKGSGTLFFSPHLNVRRHVEAYDLEGGKFKFFLSLWQKESKV